MAEHVVAPRLQQELAVILQRERARLRRSIGALAEATRALSESQGAESDAAGDLGDVASDLTEQTMDTALHQAERARLVAVEAALARMSEGAYGVCEQCGGSIATERLYAHPWASSCIRCARHSPRADVC